MPSTAGVMLRPGRRYSPLCVQLRPSRISQTAHTSSSTARTSAPTPVMPTARRTAPARPTHTPPSTDVTPTGLQALRRTRGWRASFRAAMMPTTSAAHRPPYRSQTEPAVHRPVFQSVHRARSSPRPMARAPPQVKISTNKAFISVPRLVYISGARPDTYRRAG